MICLTVALELLKQISDQQSMLHHYGLHIIESMIKYKWNLLKNDERNFIKKQLFFIIKSSYLNQTFTDPIYIRNALAKCLVELIKRDCFEKVNTTFDEIVNIIQGMAQIQGSLKQKTLRTELSIGGVLFFEFESVAVDSSEALFHRRDFF